jgi:hypothetical protein
VLAVAAAVLTLTGCSSTSNLPAAPRHVTVDEHRYVIGPMDTVNIIVWRNPELTTTVPVRPDGRITTPLAEDRAGDRPQPFGTRAGRRKGTVEVHPRSVGDGDRHRFSGTRTASRYA